MWYDHIQIPAESGFIYLFRYVDLSVCESIWVKRCVDLCLVHVHVCAGAHTFCKDQRKTSASSSFTVHLLPLDRIFQ